MVAIELRGDRNSKPNQGDFSIMYSLDRSPDCTMGYVRGDRNWLGLALIPSHTDSLELIFCLSYEDKDLAKSFGAKWDKRIGWHMPIRDLAMAAITIAQILNNHDLAEALSEGKQQINFHIQSPINKAAFDKHWIEIVAGQIPTEAPASDIAEACFLQSGDVELPTPATKPKADVNPYFCGLAMSDEGIKGFVIKFPYSAGLVRDLKQLARYADCDLTWNPSKKFWVIGLSVANLFADPTYCKRRAVHAFFEGFAFSKGAKVYFPDPALICAANVTNI